MSRIGRDRKAMAARAALELDLPEIAIAQGLKAVRWPARLQRLTAGADGAANGTVGK